MGSGFPVGRFVDAENELLNEIELTSLSPSFFAINTEYYITTPQQVGLFVLPVPEASAQAVSGVIESWWYPKTLFVVFPAPPVGQDVWFRPGDVLCSLLPVQCDQLRLVELDPVEYADQQRRRRQYEGFQHDRSDLQWVSAGGRTFSHSYRVWANHESMGG